MTRKRRKRWGKRKAHIPRAVQRAVLERDGFACTVCGRRGKLNLHHVQREADGGAAIVENLVTVCVPCHREIHEAHLEATDDLYAARKAWQRYTEELSHEQSPEGSRDSAAGS